MKPNKFSFLFFLLFVFSILISQTYAQVIDSVDYYNKLIKNPKKADDLASAFTFFNAYKKVNDNSKIKTAYSLIKLAEIKEKLGYLSDSEVLDINALEILDGLDNTELTIQYKVTIYNHLGRIHRQKKEYPEALKYYEKSLEIAKTSSQINIIRNNIGFVYEQQNKLKKALKEYQMAYNNDLKNDVFSYQTARSLSNLGVVKSQLGQENALADLEKALSIRDSLKYINGIQTSYEHLARHYLFNKDTLQSNYYAKKALDNARESESLRNLESALGLNIDVGNLTVAPEYKSINDELIDLENEQRSDYSMRVYQYEKKEEDLRESEKMKIIYFAIALFTLMSAVFLYFIQRSKHQKEKLKEIYNTETRISKKVHDEVANDVYYVMTKLQNQKNTKEQVLDDLEDIYIKTRDISKENSIVNVSNDFAETLKDLLLSYKSLEVEIVTKNISKIAWEDISEEKKKALYRVLQELMTNMRKHSKATIAAITFEQPKKSKVTVIYKDNGVGNAIVKGNGLTNTENRIKAVNGTIIFESQKNKGFQSIITV